LSREIPSPTDSPSGRRGLRRSSFLNACWCAGFNGSLQPRHDCPETWQTIQSPPDVHSSGLCRNVLSNKGGYGYFTAPFSL
jgi:hypothetical protein